ncbi:hypothetical protein, partial [Pseudomonas aeruginosa]|uniref:hypothetical protein n=1 Tax=Pseudomonas aeruginosa TaxID=287 RepID=UPI002FE409C1
GLLALTGVLGIGEGHLFHHRKARRLVSGDFAKSGSLFQDFLSGAHGMPAIFAWLKQYRVALQDSLFQGALR